MVTGNEVSAVKLSRGPRTIRPRGNSKPVTTFASLDVLEAFRDGFLKCLFALFHGGVGLLF
jgi:hypothetical protein